MTTPTDLPLAGLRVVELGGIGPAPFAAMMLADFGADVVRIERPDVSTDGHRFEVLNRGRRSMIADLKRPEAVEVVLELVERSDVLLEGWRPGVAERLGLGPGVCLQTNPRLVYGRMSGYGQDGPWAQVPGHDVNYLALAGALNHIGRAGEPPVIPVNFIGDFGGGGMVLAFGVLAAVRIVDRGGPGQVVDASMVEGAALLTAHLHGLRSAGRWRDERGTNSFDSGSHYYNVYETADGEYLSIGCLEAHFEDRLLAALGIEPAEDRDDPATWPMMKERLAATFRTRTLAEWTEQLSGLDICAAPVLGFGQVAEHPQNRWRGTFIELDGVLQPGPAPRLSMSPAQVRHGPPMPGAHTEEILRELGRDEASIGHLLTSGALR